MFVDKFSIEKLDDRIVIPAFFMTAAFLAGSKRFIHLFEGSCAGGLIVSATAGSACVFAAKTFVDDEGEELYDLAQKCLAVAIAVIVAPIVCKLLAERVSLSMDSSLKFGIIEAGIVLTTQFALPLLQEAPVKDPKKPYVPIEKEDLQPIEKEDLQPIEIELDAIKGTQLQEWQIKEAVANFNVDQILDVLSEDDVIENNLFKRIYKLGVADVFDPNDHDGVLQTLEGNLDGYRRGGLGVQEQEVKRYAQKIFGYLIQKKRAWEAEVDPITRNDTYEGVRDLIIRTVTSFNDAHDDCVDQVLSQVENLAIMVVDDFDLAENHKLAALGIIAYRNALIKEVVRETREYHAADMERALTCEIYRELALPAPRCVRVGAAFENIFNRENFNTAKANFLVRYQPRQHLIEGTNYFLGRKLFSAMCQWYQGILKKLDKDAQDRLEKRWGTDFSTDGFENVTNAHVIYFLQKNGIIEKPV